MRIGVTGHQDLPPAAESYLARAVTDRLAPDPALVVVCSLAVGADQLVASLAVELGGRLEVVVPCAGYESTFHGAGGPAEYVRLLAAAADIEHLTFPSPLEEAFMAAGRRVVERCERLLAVWDGLPSRGHGGTADVVAYATARGVPVDVVWPPGVHRVSPA